jgi:hypothetical protein
MRSLAISSAFASNHSNTTSKTHQSKKKVSTSLLKALFQPQSTPPKKLPMTNSSRTLSQGAVKLVAHTLHHSLSRSTRKAYSHSIDLFNTFCDKENIPLQLRLPASELLLCAFAASNAGISSGNTVRNHISALKAWHYIHDVEWRGSTRLHLVLRGVKNLTPLSSKRLPRSPIDSKMLTMLVRGLDLHEPQDAAIAACASTAFWGQCRLGELLGTSHTDFSTSSRPARTNLRRSNQDMSSYILHLPCTKTNRHGDDAVLVEQSGITNPSHLLRSHFKINNLADHFPFILLQHTQGPRVLTKRIFLDKCNTIWTHLGFPRITGHSFRDRTFGCRNSS